MLFLSFFHNVNISLFGILFVSFMMCHVHGMEQEDVNPDSLRMRAYNVCHGNCMVLRDKNNSLIVDCGERGCENTVNLLDDMVDFMRNSHVYIYITHEHLDHYSLLQGIFRRVMGWNVENQNEQIDIVSVFFPYMNVGGANIVGGTIFDQLHGVNDGRQDLIHPISYGDENNHHHLLLEDFYDGFDGLANIFDGYIVRVFKQYMRPVVGNAYMIPEHNSVYNDAFTIPLLVEQQTAPPLHKILFTGDANDMTYKAWYKTCSMYRDRAEWMSNISFLVVPHHGLNNNGEAVFYAHVVSHTVANNLRLLVSGGSAALILARRRGALVAVDPYIVNVACMDDEIEKPLLVYAYDDRDGPVSGYGAENGVITEHCVYQTLHSWEFTFHRNGALDAAPYFFGNDEDA